MMGKLWATSGPYRVEVDCARRLLRIDREGWAASVKLDTLEALIRNASDERAAPDLQLLHRDARVTIYNPHEVSITLGQLRDWMSWGGGIA